MAPARAATFIPRGEPRAGCMGLFGRLFGKPKEKPRRSRTPRKRANVGLVPDQGPPPVDEGTFAQGPFPRKVKVRPVYRDYGLRGRWKVVQLDEAGTWASAREQLIQEYYERFGLMRLRDGTKAIRWNEFTWRGIRETLQFEQDPGYAGVPGGAPPEG